MSECLQETNCDDSGIDAELGLSEDHFSRPEGLFGFTNVEELENAIENCKEMILETTEMSEKRKQLVRKIVQLRLKLQETKESDNDSPPEEKVLMGHKFTKSAQLEESRDYCEKCCRIIIPLLHTWYRCYECGYRCHNKCLDAIKRMCAKVKIQENPTYNLDVCPEVGLAVQKYRCAECHSRILFKVGFAAPKLCDYNGLYYCSYCNWENTAVIPARVARNWDFHPRKVSRNSLQLLRLMLVKAVLDIEKINPALFSFVEELALVKRYREDILIMKRYFLSCQAALQLKLLLKLKDRQHFVENSNFYSMKDLIDIQSGALLEYLKDVHSSYEKHIVDECESCRGKGFICEICRGKQLLFPFQVTGVSCQKCSSLFHRDCYERHQQYCPKCERRAQK